MNIKLTLSIVLTVAACFVLSGCTEGDMPTINLGTRPQKITERTIVSAQKFQQPTDNSVSTNDSAVMELSEKYTQAQDDLEAERQKNKELIRVNQDLEERLLKTEGELAQTTQELNEANDLLVKKQIEAANWKTEVLGFREEMRNADIAQLEALYKVLRILGADVEDETVAAANAF